MIAAGAIVCADAQIGDSVILNTSCIVDHECEIGESAHICPAAALAGRVRIAPGRSSGLARKSSNVEPSVNTQRSAPAPW